MASPGLSELATTTIQNYTRKLADNMSINTALLFRLREKGNKKLVYGGRSILQELDYANNATFMYYDGYEQLNVSASDVFTAAEYEAKQASVSVVISGREKRQNMGKEQMIDLLSGRIKNAERTMINNLSTGVYSDGTGSSGKQIGGLQLLVADTPTNTVGGISGNTYTFWRNISYDATTDGGSAVTAGNIQRYMNAVYVQLVRNRDKPDLIVADNNYWRAYLESLQAIQRITNDKMAQAGFENLKYMSADVVLDGGVSGSCPTNHMYFLNTNYIFYRPYAEADMVVEEEIRPTNQDAIVKPILWMGNMTVSNRRLQGVLKD